MPGFLTNLVRSFTGSEANDRIREGQAAIRAGGEQAATDIRTGGQQAQDYVRPYREQGGRASGMYGDTLGVNGAEARTRAQDTYFSDPVLQRQLELQQRNRGWASNARGGWGDGADRQAIQRTNLQNYGTWQNRLQGEGQQGYGAAAQSSNAAMQTGTALGNARLGSTSQLGQSYGDYARAANTGAQNTIGLIGAVGSLFGGRPAPATNALGSAQQGNNISYAGNPLSQSQFQQQWDAAGPGYY